MSTGARLSLLHRATKTLSLPSGQDDTTDTPQWRAFLFFPHSLLSKKSPLPPFLLFPHSLTSKKMLFPHSLTSKKMIPLRLRGGREAGRGGVRARGDVLGVRSEVVLDKGAAVLGAAVQKMQIAVVRPVVEDRHDLRRRARGGDAVRAIRGELQVHLVGVFIVASAALERQRQPVGRDDAVGPVVVRVVPRVVLPADAALDLLHDRVARRIGEGHGLGARRVHEGRRFRAHRLGGRPPRSGLLFERRLGQSIDARRRLGRVRASRALDGRRRGSRAGEARVVQERVHLRSILLGVLIDVAREDEERRAPVVRDDAVPVVLVVELDDPVRADGADGRVKLDGQLGRFRRVRGVGEARHVRQVALDVARALRIDEPHDRAVGRVLVERVIGGDADRVAFEGRRDEFIRRNLVPAPRVLRRVEARHGGDDGGNAAREGQHREHEHHHRDE
mmetsp:Transcript_23085/g.91567  ORF Transcript_23085/g.91567 Transcript_23085/m.91567 type:complete len:447 (+) Transcript_23085:1111-2451(+)